MPEHDINRRAPARQLGATVLALSGTLLAALLLAACGGSSKSGSTATTSTSASSSTSTQTRGEFAARGAALRTCLKNAGITLPESKRGQHTGGPFGAGAGGGFKLPKGVSRTQLREAFKKCGGGFAGGRRFGARNPQRLAKFASCMRQNGVNLPAPNTSGKGPVFDTKGIDATSATFKKADAKCVGELRPPGGAPGAGGAGGAGGVPGGGGNGTPPGEPPA
jgi:hypothetical protein